MSQICCEIAATVTIRRAFSRNRSGRLWHAPSRRKSSFLFDTPSAARYRVALRLLRHLGRDMPGLITRVPPVPLFARTDPRRRGGLVPGRAAAIAGLALQRRGRGLDASFQLRHQLAARQARRDRVEKFQRDPPAPLQKLRRPQNSPELTAAGTSGTAKRLIQRRDAGLIRQVPARRGPRPFGKDDDRASLLPPPPGPRPACGAAPPRRRRGRSRSIRRAPRTSHRTAPIAARASARPPGRPARPAGSACPRPIDASSR